MRGDDDDDDGGFLSSFHFMFIELFFLHYFSRIKKWFPFIFNPFNGIKYNDYIRWTIFFVFISTFVAAKLLKNRRKAFKLLLHWEGRRKNKIEWI